MMGEGFAQLPRVDFKDLYTQVVSTDSYELACEKLALALFKHHVCIISLSAHAWSPTDAFAAFCALQKVDVENGEGSSPCYTTLQGRTMFEFRLNGALWQQLPQPSQATSFTVRTSAGGGRHRPSCGCSAAPLVSSFAVHQFACVTPALLLIDDARKFLSKECCCCHLRRWLSGIQAAIYM
jgi:hypothetical protein